MNPREVKELDENPALPISPRDEAQGWHRCPTWNHRVIGPMWPEFRVCQCGPELRKDKAPEQ